MQKVGANGHNGYAALIPDLASLFHPSYVMKVEPHSNGPLFTEMHCLLRLGLPKHREDWKVFFFQLSVSKP